MLFVKKELLKSPHLRLHCYPHLISFTWSKRQFGFWKFGPLGPFGDYALPAGPPIFR
jgi:hypothetical protein